MPAFASVIRSNGWGVAKLQMDKGKKGQKKGNRGKFPGKNYNLSSSKKLARL